MKKLNFLLRSLCLCFCFLATIQNVVAQEPQGQLSAILQKSANVPSGIIPSGQIFTYTLTFSIVGTGTASGVILSDEIPAPLEIVGPIVAGTGTAAISPSTATGTLVTVTYPSLPTGTIKQVQVNVRFPRAHEHRQPECAQRHRPTDQIGRASCRERV